MAKGIDGHNALWPQAQWPLLWPLCWNIQLRCIPVSVTVDSDVCDSVTHNDSCYCWLVCIIDVASRDGRGLASPLSPPTSVVNSNLCSKTNDIYTRCMHFRVFCIPQNASAVGDLPQTLLGEHSALPRPPSWGTGGSLSPFGLDFPPFRL